MKKFNLLGTEEKLQRDVTIRANANKEKNKALACMFGREYFDGTREQGYGGYYYDGRWVAVARRIIDRYRLPLGAKVLDVGCAKGFLIHDLKTIRPDLSVYGLDISQYAIDNAFPTIKASIERGSCDNLPFENDFFDAVVCINTIHNLDADGCERSLAEIRRVVKAAHNTFIQVDAYTSDDELETFEEWVLTAKTYMKPEDWCKLFEKVGYSGDYFWTIIGFK